MSRPRDMLVHPGSDASLTRFGRTFRAPSSAASGLRAPVSPPTGLHATDLNVVVSSSSGSLSGPSSCPLDPLQALVSDVDSFIFISPAKPISGIAISRPQGSFLLTPLFKAATSVDTGQWSRVVRPDLGECAADSKGVGTGHIRVVVLDVLFGSSYDCCKVRNEDCTRDDCGNANHKISQFS